MRSKESDRQKGIKLLERDLKHCPYHCFGRCSTDFCTHAQCEPTCSVERGREEGNDTEEVLEDVLGKNCSTSIHICFTVPCKTCRHVDAAVEQERLWEETLDDTLLLLLQTLHDGRGKYWPVILNKNYLCHILHRWLEWN